MKPNMPSQFLIRKAELADAVGLASCMHSAYSNYSDIIEKIPPMHADYYAEIKQFPAWVIESNKQIIAGLIMDYEKQYAYITNIAVHPDYQGLGISKQLMEFAEKMAKNKKYKEIRLTTHILLSENISLYEYFGWIEISRDDTRIYMNKNI